MEWLDKIGYVLLGIMIGYVIGRFHSYLRDIKEEMDEVDDIVKNRLRDEGGFMRRPLVADVAILLSLALCVWAAFSTQSTNNKLKENFEADQIQDAKIAAIVTCNQDALQQTLNALAARASSAQNRADANVELQQAQLTFLTTIADPKVSEEKSLEAYERYVMLLNEFIEASGTATDEIIDNPYPKVGDLAKCYDIELKKEMDKIDAA